MLVTPQARGAPSAVTTLRVFCTGKMLDGDRMVHASNAIVHPAAIQSGRDLDWRAREEGERHHEILSREVAVIDSSKGSEGQKGVLYSLRSS